MPIPVWKTRVEFDGEDDHTIYPNPQSASQLEIWQQKVSFLRETLEKLKDSGDYSSWTRADSGLSKTERRLKDHFALREKFLPEIAESDPSELTTLEMWSLVEKRLDAPKTVEYQCKPGCSGMNPSIGLVLLISFIAALITVILVRWIDARAS